MYQPISKLYWTTCRETKKKLNWKSVMSSPSPDPIIKIENRTCWTVTPLVGTWGPARQDCILHTKLLTLLPCVRGGVVSIKGEKQSLNIYINQTKLIVLSSMAYFVCVLVIFLNFSFFKVLIGIIIFVMNLKSIRFNVVCFNF